MKIEFIKWRRSVNESLNISDFRNFEISKIYAKNRFFCSLEAGSRVKGVCEDIR